MKLRFFDFEVFPNWWCCVIGDEPDDWKTFNEDIKSSFVYISSDDENAREKLMALLKEPGYCITGYNIKHYDLMIANGIYQGFTPQQIRMINDIIINPRDAYKSKEHLRMMPFTKKTLSGVVFQDLMDDAVGSLKEKEAILGLDILESSVSFDKEDLTEEDKADVLYYCRHDVYSAMVWFDMIVRPYTETKMATAKAFGISENQARFITNAKLVALALKAKRKEFSDSETEVIDLPPKVKPYIYDNLPKNVINHLTTSKEGLSIKLFNNDVDFGNGGIHSVYCPNLYVESNDEWMLMNVDATSYYPSLLIQQKCISRCITEPEKFKWIFDERVRIKHKKDKTPEDDMLQAAYKLILNTTFGASGNKYLELYDPYMCTRTCRLGQMLLAALACKLVNYVPGLKIIQTNTDGILAYFRRKDLETVRKFEREWEEVTGIKLEEDLMKRIWQRDVNNYLAEHYEGEPKTKGGWLNHDMFRKGYVMLSPLTGYVSAKAAKDFLISGKPIVESIVKNNNLTDFIIVCKKGPSYSKVVQRMADGTEVELYKCNRVIASKDKSLGMLYKIKKYKDRLSYTKMPNIPENCRTMNRALDTYDWNEVKKELDYMYYIQRTYDLLDIPWVTFDNDKIIKENRFDI